MKIILNSIVEICLRVQSLCYPLSFECFTKNTGIFSKNGNVIDDFVVCCRRDSSNSNLQRKSFIPLALFPFEKPIRFPLQGTLRSIKEKRVEQQITQPPIARIRFRSSKLHVTSDNHFSHQTGFQKNFYSVVVKIQAVDGALLK